MITSLIIDGLLHILWVRHDKNKQRQVCRIYSIFDSRIPVRVIDEAVPGTGLFRNKGESDRIVFNGYKPTLIPA